MTELHAWYLRQEEPRKSCLLAMRDLILAFNKNITETRKYGMPCFCYTNKMFCYLWTNRRTHEPYLLMVEGKHLRHPALEKGTRSRMKILRVDPHKDLPQRTITEILKSALDLYRTGIVKAKEAVQ